MAAKNTADKSADSPGAPSEPEEGPSSDVDTDPYKLRNFAHFRPPGNYKYRQKVLVFGNRGISQLGRHLLKDLRALLPHHKPEFKWDGKQAYAEINELCELNSALYVESRKNEMLLWLAKAPYGPTLKSRVTNVHTLKDSTFFGNCLARSRPLLTFDRAFEELPHLRLLRTLLTQTLGTPNNHPKSMPFHDHCLSFFLFDGRIFVRHYQIAPKNEFALNSPDNQTLTEIGRPRHTRRPAVRTRADPDPQRELFGHHALAEREVKRFERAVKTQKKRRGPKRVGAAHAQELEDLPEDELSVPNVFGAPARGSPDLPR